MLAEFLDEQKARWSASTSARYETIVHLLKSYCESYWPGHDDEHDRVIKAGGTYCGTFGPEDIPSAFPMFLDYFMPYKVIGREVTFKAAGPVVKKLAKWLVAKGYAPNAGDFVD